MEAAEAGPPVTIRLRRGDIEHDLELQPREKCDVELVAVDGHRLAMVAHSHRVFVSSGLIDFMQSDVELQTLIAHELGHHIGGHYRERAWKKIIAGTVGGLLTAPVIMAAVTPGAMASAGAESGGPAAAILGGFGKASETTVHGAFAAGGLFAKLGGRLGRHGDELEADYIASYALARAGIETGQAVDVWRRVPADSMLLREHIRKDGRLENLSKSLAEIDDRRNGNQPLVPNADRRPSNEGAHAESNESP